MEKALLGGTTYRSLGEQRLSPAEERFEKGRRMVGWFLAPAVTVLFLVLPLDMAGNQQTLGAVLLGVVAMSHAEKNTVIAFGITVTLWLVPAVVGLVAGTDSDGS